MEPDHAGGSLSPVSASVAVPQVRRRAPAACRVCRQRKVKCNVTAVGIPCFNCVRDGHSCEVNGRKKRTHPVPSCNWGVTSAPSTSSSADLPSTIANSKLPIPGPMTTPPDTCPVTPFVHQNGMQNDEEGENATFQVDPNITTFQEETAPERGPDDYAIESLASSIMEDTVEATSETFYVGDQQGIGYILDIVGESNVIPQHYGLPYMVATHDLTPQDVAYLRAKGVFSVPSEPVCQALFRAYFYHIHPILPVVDAVDVLTSFRNGGASAINLLLLWSMFSVAANHVDKVIVRQAGYQSHKEMKKSMFVRAKCLYDNGCEENRISIIQSVCLLAFWYSDLGERTESWHWMGIAISLSQTLGLNRDPDRGQYNKRLSDRQRQLWRRIWWSCFFRDRWLSLGMGRPMRIHARDCNTPIPSSEDLINDLSELSAQTRSMYIPADFDQLAECWVILLHLSQVLGTILSENYNATGSLPSRVWVEATEQDLMRCISQAGGRPEDSSPSLTFYSYHLRLHFNAATIALWRPYTNRAPPGVPPDQEAVWFALVHQKIRAAAGNTNTMLDKVISNQLIGYIGPMTVPLLVPAMNSHLLESKSSDPLIRQSSLNKLDLFMIVLRKIQDVYSSATFIRGLFLQAIEKLNSPRYTGANTPQIFSPPQHSIGDSASQTTLQGRIDHIPIDTLWQIEDHFSEFWDPLPTSSNDETDGNDAHDNDTRNF
ncbi:fungal-specific transcription factor domain-containing protein [Xylaria bambusicola]|uniref:fungal-specific transcription factor domain-containing protein n=1 Tax=Xylaria bambusicola TaxID=326684 RepID=UPI0020078280|nr:fungal-specific transcription factor domain-containing protein [Xylaria bambusicola]KAI0513087.1 fungal-specific transcription factor domain-containing protein [Xylaria bambusicola]